MQMFKKKSCEIIEVSSKVRMPLHNLFQPIVLGSKDRIRESFPALAKETFPLITVDKKCIKQKRNDFVAVPFFALALDPLLETAKIQA